MAKQSRTICVINVCHLCHPLITKCQPPVRFSSKSQEESSSVLAVTALECWEDYIKNVTLSTYYLYYLQEQPAQPQVAYQEGPSLAA